MHGIIMYMYMYAHTGCIYTCTNFFLPHPMHLRMYMYMYVPLCLSQCPQTCLRRDIKAVECQHQQTPQEGSCSELQAWLSCVSTPTAYSTPYHIPHRTILYSYSIPYHTAYSIHVPYCIFHTAYSTPYHTAYSIPYHTAYSIPLPYSILYHTI